MPRDPDDPHFSGGGRTTAELVRSARESTDENARWDAIRVLHFRGSAAEYAAAEALARDRDPACRQLAADILGQLGWDERTFLDESVDVLIHLLRDPDQAVVAAAAMALGHRKHPRAIPRLLELVGHSGADVRRGVVNGLSCHDDLGAIRGLITLSRDSDRDVRDWATFGLASLTDADSPELRDALYARATDDDPEVRGEALIGLALRRDGRAMGFLRAELGRPLAGDWPFEAAEHLAEPSLYPLLERAWDTLSMDDQARLGDSFRAALAACRRGPEE